MLALVCGIVKITSSMHLSKLRRENNKLQLEHDRLYGLRRQLEMDVAKVRVKVKELGEECRAIGTDLLNVEEEIDMLVKVGEHEIGDAHDGI